VEVAIVALGGGSDEAVAPDGPSLGAPGSLAGVGGVELGGVVGEVGVVVVVVVGVQFGVPVDVVPEVALASGPGVDGVEPVAGVAGVAPAGQATGGVKVGAGPKKATRSVEMLVGSPSVTWATNTRGAAVEAFGPSSQTAVPR
jgi:hypothetical protein